MNRDQVRNIIAATTASLTHLTIAGSYIDLQPMFSTLPVNLRHFSCVVSVTREIGAPLKYLDKVLPLLINLRSLEIGIQGHSGTFRFIETLHHLKDIKIIISEIHSGRDWTEEFWISRQLNNLGNCLTKERFNSVIIEVARFHFDGLDYRSLPGRCDEMGIPFEVTETEYRSS